MRRLAIVAVMGGSALVGPVAHAAAATPGSAPPASASATPEASAPTQPPSSEPAPSEPTPSQRWIEQHRPTPHMVELGLAIGPFMPPAAHGLVDEQIFVDSEGAFFQRYNGVAGEYDLRLGYYPTPWLGLEVEGGIAPTFTLELRERADLFGVRGQVVAQWPRWRLTPVVLLGGGLLGTHGALGTDVDPAGHFGAGGKLLVNDQLVLRVDFRDALAAGTGVAVAHYLHLTIGVSHSFRPRRQGRARNRAR